MDEEMKWRLKNQPPRMRTIEAVLLAAERPLNQEEIAARWFGERWQEVREDLRDQAIRAVMPYLHRLCMKRDEAYRGELVDLALPGAYRVVYGRAGLFK